MERTKQMLRMVAGPKKKRRKCNLPPAQQARMKQESPVPPGAEKEVQYLMNELDTEFFLYNPNSDTSNDNKGNKKKGQTSDHNIQKRLKFNVPKIAAQQLGTSVTTSDFGTLITTTNLGTLEIATNHETLGTATDPGTLVTPTDLGTTNATYIENSNAADVSTSIEVNLGILTATNLDTVNLDTPTTVDLGIPTGVNIGTPTVADLDTPTAVDTPTTVDLITLTDVDLIIQTAADDGTTTAANDDTTTASDLGTPTTMDLDTPISVNPVIPTAVYDGTLVAADLDTPTAADLGIPTPATSTDLGFPAPAVCHENNATVAHFDVSSTSMDENIPATIDFDAYDTIPIISSDSDIIATSFKDDIPTTSSGYKMPSTSANYDSLVTSAEKSLQGQRDSPYAFTISTPELLNADSPFTNIPSVASSELAHASDSSINPVTRPKTITKRKDKGRIRGRYESDWKNVKRKLLKNSGKCYQSKDGTERPKKEMKPPCACKKKCCEKISDEHRLRIFENFWKLADHARQWDFITRFTSTSLPKRIKRNGPNKSQIITYFLPKNAPSSTCINIEKISVCRTMFLNTLCISEKTVRTALRKLVEGNGSITLDKRGSHKNRPHKIHQSVHQSAIDHIKSLAPVESHYCRKRSSKIYLDGNLNFVRLYNLYKDWYEDNKDNYEKLATNRQYQDTVNENFNVEFYIPKKDMCDKCHIFNNITHPTDQEKGDYNLHISHKNFARELKSKDKEEAIASMGKTVTACFDLQKVLTCPHGNVSIFYYKRKMSLYNFTIFDMADKSGYCYMWQEATAKKGSNEISSGLFSFITRKSEAGVKVFRFWSDNCSGQNRNRIVFAMYQYMVINRDIENITHRFLEVGHTQTEGDNVHSVIERASKNKMLYTPEQWFNLIRWAKSGSPYIVQELTQQDIFDFKTLLNGRNWTYNDKKEKVNWTQIKEVHVNKENPSILYYKYELEELEYSCITTLKKTRSKKTIVTNVQTAYKSIRGIPKDKLKDLIELCESKIIPEEFQRFFMTLKSNEDVETESDADDE